MGGVISSEADIPENALLKKLTGLEPVGDNDPFWNTLLSFNLKVDETDKEVAEKLDEGIGDLLQALMYNTQTTGNFSSLIRVFLRRATELQASEQCENKIYLWQTANSLTILRFIFKFLTERMNETEFVKVFGQGSKKTGSTSDDDSSDEESDLPPSLYENPAEEFIVTLVWILVNLRVNELTMGIHVETVKCMLTLLSSQLYNENIVTTSIIFGYFINGACSKHSAELSKALLNNYLNHNSEYSPMAKRDSGSLVLSMASGLWSMVQLATGLEDDGEQDKQAPITLGSLSILLLLNLACHHPARGTNPFKETLAAFQNSQEVSSLSTGISTFKIPYTALYERLCATANHEPPMLLLYLVLHRNSGFRNFILSRINLENLVIPVLRILHDGVTNPGINNHHIYLALIVMLILSEDDYYCKIIHETNVSSIDWLDTDIPLREITLGGLSALVLVRTIQKNTVKMKDRYLHTNSLAALCNMSACFKYLAPLVCQRLIGLLEMLSKRHAKMVEHMKLQADLDVEESHSHNFHEDITALEEGIRTLLEVINCCLSASLRYNPNLVYTLLYHRNLFDTYKQHPMFQDLLPNIATVIGHFSTKVVNVKSGDAAAMRDIIEKEVVAWPTDRLVKFPDLKFRYMEDENTTDFFVPYVWRLTIQHSAIRFDPQRVKLFNALSIT